MIGNIRHDDGKAENDGSSLSPGATAGDSQYSKHDCISSVAADGTEVLDPTPLKEEAVHCLS